MKRKTLQKVSFTAVLLVLAVTMLFVSSDIGRVTVQASDHIREMTGEIQTNIEQYYNENVLYKLPDGIGNDDEISVIIRLDNKTVIEAYNKTDKTLSVGEYAATEAASALRAQTVRDRNAILETLDKKGVEYQIGAEYYTVLSGFELIIKAGDFKTVSKSLGKHDKVIIGEVYEQEENQLVENEVNFDEATGIFDSSDFKYDGSGMLIAVLDTGLDYTHSAFSVENFDPSAYAITKEDVAKLLSDTRAYQMLGGLAADDVYVNEKVPFAFDYADEDSDVYSLHNNHGTHVSGVIVGKDDTIRGVAPNAQLVSMKIFSDVKESAYTSWILAALEDCVILGVDVINMSLGTACGFSRQSDAEAVSGVYDDIRELGISLVVAASNSFSSAQGSDKNGNLPLTSNPDTGTVGSPSTYEGAFSIASINGVKTPYLLYNGQILYFDEATNAATDERNFFDELLPSGTDSMEFEYLTVPGAGRDGDYSGMDVTGKIVLVERGFTTFEEKANIAEKKGAAGIIIYNNVSGDIKMNVGTSEIPVCSIKQDDGKMLAEAKTGTLKISRSQTSGPFMSDFSSWGPTPDLGIKPEITAHGGNILSAITGGSYDRLSGTSMACPNMAGVVALMKQYVMDAFPEIADDPKEVTAHVNRLLMSTADIVINKNGLPYAVRKQGSGLANLTDAATTTAYILTYNEDGSVMDKTKIELGDDPEKKGVYTLRFSIENFGDTTLSYDLSAFAMTEGVSDTKTNDGETAVTGDGYMLNGTVVNFEVSGANKDGNTVTVSAGSTANVTVTLTLSEADKAYMTESFENGMYVEGFVKLTSKDGKQADLNVPYLAFFGDWTKAPLFDLDYFETYADELDESIDLLDKTLPDAYATRPIGGVSQDYVSYLGAYYFLQDPASTKIISAEREYIALSNTEGTVHSLRFVWAGMLRNAERIEISIIDDTTGEVIFEKTEKDIRKSYGDGGTIRPSNIKIEFDTAEYNLKNNTEYTVRLVGYLDYQNDGAETNENNVFEFPLVTDFEAPAITGCTFRTEYDKELKKNRLFAELAVYDNHYTMAMLPGYVGISVENDQAGYELVPFDEYLTPVYSVRDGVTYVEYELTDHVEDIKNNSAHKNTFTVACYDYALNEATYEIALPDDYIDFYFENSDVKLSPNELFTLKPLMYPQTEWGELLHYTSSNPDVAKVVGNKIVAGESGVATIIAYQKNEDGTNGKSTSVKVTVLKEGDEGYQYFDKPVAERFELVGYDTLKAYYLMDTSERELGETGDYCVLSKNSLSFYPSESIQLHYRLESYFPDDTEVVFESSNEKIVTVNRLGVITAQEEGFASVTVRVMMDGKSTYYSQSLDIEVKNPFVTSAPALTHYFGLGGVVEIPERLLLTRIEQFAFSNFEYIPKTEDDVISEDEPDTTKIWYIGDNTITKVIIPEGVETIGPYAFANLTALKEVVLPSTLESIEYGAFYGCSSLTKVKGIENVKLINKEAFYGCKLTGTLSLDNARAVGDYAFAGNTALKEVVLPETLQSIGGYAFYGDSALAKVTVKADKVKYGRYVFAECTSLTEMTMNANVIPEGAFYGAEKLSKVTIGKDVLSIGETAFAETAIETFDVASGNTVFKTSADKKYITSADGKTLVLVSPGLSGAFQVSDTITTVGKGAFSSNKKLTSVVMPGVTVIEDYAFAYSSRLEKAEFGNLKKIGNYAFFKTSVTELPDISALKQIGNYAFAYTAIKTVTIPNGMTVGEGAFCECDALKTVVIGDGVTLETGAFMLSRDENSTLVRDPSFTDKKIYSYEYLSAMQSLTIGKKVQIGASAFMGAAKLTNVTLGEGAVIGNRAFYNCASLAQIDLSKVVSIGDGAFSGDELYVYLDRNGNSFAMDGEGNYIFKTYAPKITEVDLSSLGALGEQAFLYCKDLVSVRLSDKIDTLPSMVFYGCESLKDINLDKVKTVGDNAFYECVALREVNLSSAEEIEKYAFVYCTELQKVTLNENGTVIGEGAFSYATALDTVTHLDKVQELSGYAFAYTAITKADLTSAVTIGEHAFLKEELTEFEVILGSALENVGDNPFAFCKLAPFAGTLTETFNGKDYTTVTYTYDISEKVHVIDGSLYCDVPNGMELIVYCGTDGKNVIVADDTVRITAYAFAGSDVVRVSLPNTLGSIGHKAFYDCDSLAFVVFTSYEAPNLEEEFDPNVYISCDHIPATGEYDFSTWDGKEISKEGLGLVPYYMWNVADGKYSNVYYGANFSDYVGKVDNFITMVRPSNGLYYDTFIYGQYFSLTADGAVAADDITLAAIKAIEELVRIAEAGESITLKHEALVLAARAAYDRIATVEQQALVTNIGVLLSAEDRIAALKADNTVDEPEDPTENDQNDNSVWIVLTVVLSSVCVLLIVAVVVLAVLLAKKAKKAIPPQNREAVVPQDAEQPTQGSPAETDALSSEEPSESEENDTDEQ